jgi:hypothetical protein
MAGVCSTLHGADPPHRIVMMTTFFDCEFLSRQTLRLTPAGLTRTIGAAWTRLTRCSSLEHEGRRPRGRFRRRGRAETHDSPSHTSQKVRTRNRVVLVASLASSGGIPSQSVARRQLRSLPTTIVAAEFKSPCSRATTPPTPSGSRTSPVRDARSDPSVSSAHHDLRPAVADLSPVSL